jgi:hypothetical protein
MKVINKMSNLIVPNSSISDSILYIRNVRISFQDDTLITHFKLCRKEFI